MDYRNGTQVIVIDCYEGTEIITVDFIPYPMYFCGEDRNTTVGNQSKVPRIGGDDFILRQYDDTTIDLALHMIADIKTSLKNLEKNIEAVQKRVEKVFDVMTLEQSNDELVNNVENESQYLLFSQQSVEDLSLWQPHADLGTPLDFCLSQFEFYSQESYIAWTGSCRGGYYDKLEPSVGPNGVDADAIEKTFGANLTKAISILESCASKTHTCMKKWCVQPDPFLEAKLVGIFAKFRYLDNAFQVLDEMCIGNLHAWLVVIGVFLRILKRLLNNVEVKQMTKVEKFCEVNQLPLEYTFMNDTPLDVHNVKGSTSSPEEAADMRLLGLICDLKEGFENAFEHYIIASMAMAANGQNIDIATIDCNIGDAYLSPLQYDEAIHAFQKAMSTYKSNKGENHPFVVYVFVRLDDLCNKIRKFIDSKYCCEYALRIYLKLTIGSPPELMSSGRGESDFLGLEIARDLKLVYYVRNVFSKLQRSDECSALGNGILFLSENSLTSQLQEQELEFVNNAKCVWEPNNFRIDVIINVHDDEVSDGTTSIVVLAGEFLWEAVKLGNAKNHPTIIIAGYLMAAICARNILLEKVVENKNLADCLADSGYTRTVFLCDAVCDMVATRITTHNFLYWLRSHTSKEIKWEGAKYQPEDKDNDDKKSPRQSENISDELKQDIQLMRFADYFERGFSAVSSSQFSWQKLFRESMVEKISYVHVSYISGAVYKTSIDWINHLSYEALDCVLADLGTQQSRSKCSKRVWAEMILQWKPDVLINLLPILSENSKGQGQEKLQVIIFIWMIVQICLGDLIVGLYLLEHQILPILWEKSGSNPETRELVLHLVENFIAPPKARSLLVSSAIRKALARSRGSKAMKQESQQIQNGGFDVSYQAFFKDVVVHCIGVVRTRLIRGRSIVTYPLEHG